MNPELNPRLRLAASVSLFALIVLCVTWETLVAPLRPGGSWMLLKALPLALPLRGIVRGNLYTYQWAAMLSLLYLMEGAVRAMSDPAPLSVLWAPVGLRYHALHHLMPSMPYHSLGEAHRRLRLHLEPGTTFWQANHKGMTPLLVRIARSTMIRG